MNRDELLTRGIAEPPAVHSYRGMDVIHPLDVSGGSWITSNTEGTTWALLNWNIGARSTRERSRGEVVLQVATLSRLSEANARMSTATLDGIGPFRLIGISPLHREVVECQWDGVHLKQVMHAWERKHWFSSGKSDELAAEKRGRVFAAAVEDADAGSLNWLRRNHASHKLGKGAFSVCVHRDDAATVSYTEVQVSPDTVKMSYRAGSPCNASTPVEVSLPICLKSQPAV